jgi:hypothetical protein
MKCSECKHCKFAPSKDGANRYYCNHKKAGESVNASARLLARTKRHSDELTIKKAPRWCPINNGGEENETTDY